MLTILSLKSCDTCRKAIAWLKEHEVDHAVHDVRADGLDAALAGQVVSAVGVDKAINKRSTTWRGLSDADRAIDSEEAAAKLLAEHPTLMKRPVFMDGTAVIAIGFDKSAQETVRDHAS